MCFLHNPKIIVCFFFFCFCVCVCVFVFFFFLTLTFSCFSTMEVYRGIGTL